MAEDEEVQVTAAQWCFSSSVEDRLSPAGAAPAGATEPRRASASRTGAIWSI